MRKLFLLLLMLPLLFSCSEAPVSVLKIGSNVWPGYEFYYMARDQGYLSPEKVRLVEFANATDVSDELLNGNIAGALLTLDEAVRLSVTGLKLKVIQVVDFSRGGDVVLAQSGIDANTNFQNKSIAVEASAVGALMLTAFKEHYKIQDDALTVEYISVDESEKAYERGTDFIISFEPFRTKILNMGAKQVFDTSYVPNLIVDVLVVREDALAKHSQEQFEYVIQAYFKALAEYKGSPMASAKILSKRLQITPQEVIESYEGIAPAELSENHSLLLEEPPGILSSIEDISEILRASNLIDGKVNARSMILADYLPKK
ncbi:MAG: ABC transporter substrate-binding protein [Bermanella sp.]